MQIKQQVRRHTESGGERYKTLQIHKTGTSGTHAQHFLFSAFTKLKHWKVHTKTECCICPQQSKNCWFYSSSKYQTLAEHTLQVCLKYPFGILEFAQTHSLSFFPFHPIFSVIRVPAHLLNGFLLRWKFNKISTNLPILEISLEP